MEARKLRFSTVGVLTPDSILLGGISAREWDKALTGNMAQTLADLKVQVENGSKKRDASKATTFDVASAAKKYFSR